MSESRLKLTLQRIFGPVKQAPGARKSHHFEGAAALVIGVTLALVAALVAAPRATVPQILPLPEPRRSTLAAQRAADRALVALVQNHGLSFDTRAVGEALRQFGVAVAAASSDADALLVHLHELARADVGEAQGRALLALRAEQTELFVEATHEWERTGHVNRELTELGGDFAALATRSGWLDGQRLVLEDDERALLFRMRWNDLTGLAKLPLFAPTLDDYKDRFSLLLRHPSGADAEQRIQHQLGYVSSLAALDHDFPALFARGVLLFRAQAYEAAADAFRSHLAAHPNGPWTLRAKNHLLEASLHVPVVE